MCLRMLPAPKGLSALLFFPDGATSCLRAERVEFFCWSQQPAPILNAHNTQSHATAVALVSCWVRFITTGGSVCTLFVRGGNATSNSEALTLLYQRPASRSLPTRAPSLLLSHNSERATWSGNKTVPRRRRRVVLLFFFVCKKCYLPVSVFIS